MIVIVYELLGYKTSQCKAKDIVHILRNEWHEHKMKRSCLKMFILGFDGNRTIGDNSNEDKEYIGIHENFSNFEGFFSHFQLALLSTDVKHISISVSLRTSCTCTQDRLYRVTSV